MKKLSAIAVTVLFFAACSGNPPRILDVVTDYHRFFDTRYGDSMERLNIQIILQDADGVDDLQAVYIINDTAELYWKYTIENWVMKTAGDDFSCFLPSLTMPSSQGFPEGLYRIVLKDLSGAQDERSITLSSADIRNSRYYSLSKTDTQLLVSPSIPKAGSATIWMYSSAGELLSSFKPGEFEKFRQLLSRDKDPAGVYCYLGVMDRDSLNSSISGPFYFP